MERRERRFMDESSIEDLTESLALVVSEGVSQALQNLSITVSLGGAGSGETYAAGPAPARGGRAAQVEREELGMVMVRAPMVGTFYSTPSPGADPYVQEGDEVEEGQTLCIIEVMKLFNEIHSPTAGRIKHILAEHGAGVEYDEILMEIEPLGD